jgi:hypothetical protein
MTNLVLVNKRTYSNNSVITQGMYTNHKSSKHDAWCTKKDCFSKGGPKETRAPTPKVSTDITRSCDPSAAKLSLSKFLQAALVTTSGLTADQFQRSGQMLAVSQETE